MYALLSPAKTLDFSTPSVEFETTYPTFEKEQEALVELMKTKSSDEIKGLMSVSDKIAELNVERYQDFANQDKKAALLAFKGDVYKGLEASSLNIDGLNFAQKHVGILSGLYGLLKSLDLMAPYRLEMGLSLENKQGKNLYEFWGDKVTKAINENVRSCQAEAIVNLASNEYSHVIKRDLLEKPLIDVVFKEVKGNAPAKIISFYAKKARGLMARYMIDHTITHLEGLKSFDIEGYVFEPLHSDATTLTFYRYSEG